MEGAKKGMGSEENYVSIFGSAQLGVDVMFKRRFLREAKNTKLMFWAANRQKSVTQTCCPSDTGGLNQPGIEHKEENRV